jgi:hypothetical protein
MMTWPVPPRGVMTSSMAIVDRDTELASEASGHRSAIGTAELPDMHERVFRNCIEAGGSAVKAGRAKVGRRTQITTAVLAWRQRPALNPLAETRCGG